MNADVVLAILRESPGLSHHELHDASGLCSHCLTVVLVCLLDAELIRASVEDGVARYYPQSVPCGARLRLFMALESRHG